MKRNILLFIMLLGTLSIAAQRDTVYWYPDVPVECLVPGWEEGLIGQIVRDESPSVLLDRFFPGSLDKLRNFIGEDEDISTLRLWSCPGCTPIRFRPMFAESDTDYVFFPFERHFTQLIEDDTFRCRTGEAYRLLSFSTSEDYPPSGRWVYGLLGLALLREQDEGAWVVVEFEPAFDMNGMYMTAFAPRDLLFEQNGNLLFRVDEPYPCGPPVTDYYPCYSDLAFYAFYQNKLQKVLQVPDISCSNFGDPKAKGSAWTTEINLVSGQAAFPDIVVRKQGHIFRTDAADDFLLKSFPQSFISGLKKGRNYSFEYTIRYTLRHTGYEIVEANIK